MNPRVLGSRSGIKDPAGWSGRREIQYPIFTVYSSYKFISNFKLLSGLSRFYPNSVDIDMPDMENNKQNVVDLLSSIID